MTQRCCIFETLFVLLTVDKSMTGQGFVSFLESRTEGLRQVKMMRRVT